MAHSTNIVRVKHGVFAIFIVIITIPLFQFGLPFIKETNLNGVDPAPPLPEFSTATWFAGDYQKNYEPAFELNTGFHNTLVRVHNQLNYTVFGFSEVGDVVVGKGNYLFLNSYINAYNGKDFLGSEYIDIQTEKIKFVQTELKKKNIALFVAFAPGKGSFYSEYIPDKLKSDIKHDSTNTACYKKMFSEKEINFLDLNSYFLSIKKNEKHPLYSNTGVHWTEYGSYIAGKKIVSYIEKLRNINMTEIKLQSVEMLSLSGNHSSDYDAASLMNVFSSISHPEYAIPKLQFVSDSTTAKPRFLCISDSYFAGIINTKIPQNVFTDYHNWLYNNGVLPEGYLRKKYVSELDAKKEIEKQDVICLLATDASLAQFPFGFINKTYELYAKKDAAYYALKNREFHCSVTRTIQNINGNYSWKKALVENAKKKGISETDEFILNALWVYEQEQLKLKNE